MNLEKSYEKQKNLTKNGGNLNFVTYNRLRKN